METMDPAELEAAMAATGAIIEELTSTGAFVFAGGLMPPSSDRRRQHRRVGEHGQRPLRRGFRVPGRSLGDRCR